MSLDVAVSTQVHSGARRDRAIDVDCGCHPAVAIRRRAGVSALSKPWKRAALVSRFGRRWCHGQRCSRRGSTCSGIPSSSRAACHGGRPEHVDRSSN